MPENSSGSSLRYIGLADATGYAVAAAALVRALRQAGVNVVWEPMLPGGALGLGYAPAASTDAGPADLRALRDDERACDTVIIHFVPEYYPHFIERERARGARLIVGHVVWETDRLPAHWPALINQLNAVIVPTEWNRTVFRDSGVVIPILVEPHLPPLCDEPAECVDREALLRRLPDLSGRRIFYTISTWLERKGVEPLVDAFARAFCADDPVALVIKTTPHDLERVRRDPGHEGEPVAVAPQFEAMIGRAVLRHRRLPPPIVLLTDDLTEGELLALHEMGDCFVSLCRAEGWGLGAFEAAWLGKPVVVTGWGGPAQYLSAETAYLVDWSPKPVTPAEPNASYTPDQNWAEPDVESAVAALRSVLFDPAEAARRGALAASRLREAISPLEVARRLWLELEDMPARGPEAPAATAAASQRAEGSKPGAEAPNPTFKDTVLRNLVFRDHPGSGAWLREFILLDRQGRPRRRARPLLYKKNGAARPASLAWLEDQHAHEGNSAEARLARMKTLRETGELAAARTLQVITKPDKHRLGEQIRASLRKTRLKCRLARRLPLSFDDDLYLVVDPHEFRLIPPVARTIFLLSGINADQIDGDLVAFLSRGLGVLVSSSEHVAALCRHGMPVRQIYFVPERLSGVPGPMIFFGMDNMLPRALHGLGVLSDDEFDIATSRLALPSMTIALCLPEYLERMENARRSLLPDAILYPGLRHVEPWMGCAASYRFLARRALEKAGPLTIYEDDAEFEPDHGARLTAIRSYLDSLSGHWDIFSGLITDLSETATLSRVEDWEGERLVTLDKTVGLVFSMFNRRAIESLANFSIQGNDIERHTIDRYLERQEFICVTPARPLVAHGTDLSSTLWLRPAEQAALSAVKNSLMSAMIGRSQWRLRFKLRTWLRESGVQKPR